MNKFIYLIYIILLSIFCFTGSVKSVNNNVKIAVVASGVVDDFGFNYMINEGMINMGRILNISKIQLVQNITALQLPALIDDLVAQGCDGIITSSFDMTDATVNASIKYPHVQFLTRGSLKNTNNLSFITYNIGICQYIIGYFAGLVTKTNKIGYIAPGLPLIPNYNANALFVGARMSNPNTTVHTYNVNDWITPDRSTGAANVLYDMGIDIISDNENDQSVLKVSVKRGVYGLGTNGFPQGQIFGQSVGLSFVTNWTSTFVKFGKIVTGATNVTFKDYGDFNTTFLQLSDFPFSVSETIRQKVRDEITRLMKIPRASHPYYCNDFNLQTYPNDTKPGTNCITSGFWFTVNKPYEGMYDYGYYNVPLTEIFLEDSVFYGVLITSCIFIFLSVILIGLVWYFKDSHSIRSASPLFCWVLILGGIITYIGCIVYVIPVKDSSCAARYWLLVVGYALLIGSLVVKNFRIYLIFESTNKSLKVIRITNTHLMPWVGGLVAVFSILMVLFTVSSVGNISAITSFDEPNLLKYQYTVVCKNSEAGNIVLYTVLAVFGVMLICGIFVSWKIRTVDIDEFNESKPIANTLYAVLLSAFIVAVLLVSPQTKNSESTIICAAAIFITTASLLILFVPKFWRIHIYGAASSEMFTRNNMSAIASSRNSNKNSSKQYSGTSSRGGGFSGSLDEEEMASKSVANPQQHSPNTSNSNLNNNNNNQIAGNPEEQHSSIHAQFDSDEDHINQSTHKRQKELFVLITYKQQTPHHT
ncbi:G-protein-coupled receptor family 3 protein 12 [Heterostelium album PN500]|uniref:G-protein-coupled receptor family 3 protein 12 n=1 Tax=Heterostelium pallidum (strain ATCC 26659 / Pp 5 / PN500) TaxID=670386 RepID=D3BRM6_HETP5|nr:G-protein-coupled receptor family 3 protein 12 [Heterostelium album PN500]EFA76058.1 G-protein-coupled receptor family 3 protein 12 [Heterostelium album PN500]|eukprot:XP_020428192.1 G-protein-coupled receptor family 3 protein 12 [Heterostelium album PN500]